MLFLKEGIMMNEEIDKSKEGYIYIYKCIVGKKDDVCKIGKTKHFRDDNDRLAQHLRTTYYGFTPYTRFDTNEVIATGFRVNNINKADTAIKNAFKDKGLSDIEIYNVSYLNGIKTIYKVLNDNALFTGIYRDGYTTYKQLININKKYILDDYKNYEEELGKDKFEPLLKELWKKYKYNYPNYLAGYICKEKDLKSYVSERHNYVPFGNGLFFNINYNYQTKSEIIKKLNDALNDKKN